MIYIMQNTMVVGDGFGKKLLRRGRNVKKGAWGKNKKKAPITG